MVETLILMLVTTMKHFVSMPSFLLQSFLGTTLDTICCNFDLHDNLSEPTITSSCGDRTGLHFENDTGVPDEAWKPLQGFLTQSGDVTLLLWGQVVVYYYSRVSILST